MNFNSPEYLLFFPAVLIAHRLTPQKYRWAVLLAASWLFYFAWEPLAGLLLIAATVISYLCALGIEKRRSAALLAAAVLTILGMLGFFKYAGFFASIFGKDLALGIILPVGISFYTFQTLSYVIDVYRGDVKAERRFGYYALFVSFFPQLVAGPIERPGRLLPQLREPKTADAEDLRAGAWLILRGYFKKVAVADMIAPAVDGVFASPESASGAAVILAAALFGLQIYCDFSGYTDIARGCARMLGVRLSENFDLPFFADSLRGFWRRWHISLTSWFTDYVYIPLGGSRRGRARHIFNILLVFALSGLWHGAGWGFVLWGLINGAGVALETLTKRKSGRLLTFAAVTLSWIFFRAETVADAAALLSRIPFDWGSLSFPQWGLGAIASAFAVYALDRAKKPSYLSVFTMLLAVFAAALALLGEGGGNAFIYLQF